MCGTRLGAVLGPILCLTLIVASANAAEALQLGVLPNVSVRVLLANHQPLRNYLERELGRPVEIVTASDFKSFHRRTRAGEYDVVVTAPHMARLAQVDAGYLPLVTYQPSLGGLLIVRKTADLPALTSLRGATLAIANPQSLVVMKGFAWLREQGLARDTDYRVSTVQNQDSIAQVLLSGEAAFGMLSSAEFLQIPSELRDRLMVFSQFIELPSFITLVNGKRLAQEAERIKSLLLRFPISIQGERFLALTGISGVRAISASEMLALDVFAADSRRMLGSP